MPPVEKRIEGGMMDDRKAHGRLDIDQCPGAAKDGACILRDAMARL